MSTFVPVEAQAVCADCQRTQKAKPDKRGGIKLPLRWKREQASSKLYCHLCWRKRYLLRALTFPVASPIRRGEQAGTWKELEADLRPMWATTTAASNWMMTQCYVRDAQPRVSGQEKIPPMPRVYLYPEARVLFPELPPQSIASLEQAVQRKYRAMRFDVSWRSSASLPTMRYPQPYPVPNQRWRFEINEQNQPLVFFRIGETNWELRLKSGFRYRRQIDGLRHMAERGEMAILKANDGTILVKLVGWLTRPSVEAKSAETLFVRTGKDHLLSALDTKGDRLWVENCDQLPRLAAAHRKQLQRFSEDQKAEQRPVPAFQAQRHLAVQKYHRRTHSAIQEVASHLANFAARRRYRQVEYNDTERWLSEFPYFQLEERIKIKLDEKGIAFEKKASGDDEEPKESKEPEENE